MKAPAPSRCSTSCVRNDSRFQPVRQSLRVALTLIIGVQLCSVPGVSAPEVSVEYSELNTLVTTRDVEDLPLNGRNFGNLAALEPGTTSYALGNNDSALFNLDSVTGESSANPIPLQIGDIDPIDTGSTVLALYGIAGNGSGGVEVAMKSGTNSFHGSFGEPLLKDKMFFFDGASWNLIASSNMIAPGSSKPYGFQMRPSAISSKFAVFSAGGNGYDTRQNGQTTLYLSQLGPTPNVRRLVGVDDPLAGGTVYSIGPVKINTQDEILVKTDIFRNGAINKGYLLYTGPSLQFSLINGDTNPLGGTFQNIGKALLNNFGSLAFEANHTIYIRTGSGTFIQGPSTFTVPDPSGATKSFAIANGDFLLDTFFDDASYFFNTPLTGSGAFSNFGEFKRYPGTIPLNKLMFWQGEPAGFADKTLSNRTFGISYDPVGEFTIGFKHPEGGSSVYVQSGDNPPSRLVSDGQSSGFSYGGTISLANLRKTFTLVNGFRYFDVDILGGRASHALIQANPLASNVLKSVVSNVYPLPTGARYEFGREIILNDHYYGFHAFRNGGQDNVYLGNRRSGIIKRIIGDYDYIPQLSGYVRSVSSFSINAHGNYVLSADIINGQPDYQAILGGSFHRRFSVIANTGGGSPVSGTTWTSFHGSCSELNYKNQFTFKAGLSDRRAGLFSYNPGPIPSISTIVTTGQTVGSRIIARLGFHKINAVGNILFEAKFQANPTSSTTAGNALFLRDPLGIHLVIGTDSTVSSGTVLNVLGAPSFNDSNETTAMVSVKNASSTTGAIIRSWGGISTVIAQDSGSTPGGGVLNLGRLDVAGIYRPTSSTKLDNLWNMAFNSNLTGGSINSAYFFMPNGGSLQLSASAGQTLPSGGLLGTIPTSSGEDPFFALANGRFVIVNHEMSIDGGLQNGAFDLISDGTIRSILQIGDRIHRTEGATVFDISTPVMDDFGNAMFQVGLTGGTAQRAIVVSPRFRF